MSRRHQLKLALKYMFSVLLLVCAAFAFLYPIERGSYPEENLIPLVVGVLSFCLFIGAFLYYLNRREIKKFKKQFLGVGAVLLSALAFFFWTHPHYAWLVYRVYTAKPLAGITLNHPSSLKVAELKGIREGMSADEVLKVLGEPHKRYDRLNFRPNPPRPTAIKNWDYEYPFFWGMLSIIFDANDRVVGIQAGY